MRRTHAVVLGIAMLWPSAATAQTATKDECIAAYTDAQHLRRSGQLLSARAKLRVCASDSCPVLLQNDCSQWRGEVEGLVPSVVFVARDAGGRDLVDVSVSMDGKSLVSRLDGRPVEVDPGEHVLRFESPGYGATEQRILFREGEKARSVSLTMNPAIQPAPSATVAHIDESAPAEARRPLPTTTWVLGGIGVLSFATSGVLGLIDLPTWNRCHQGGCSSSDKSFSDSLNVAGDVAMVAGGGSLLAAAYFFVTRPSVAIEPQVSPHAANLNLRVQF